MDPKVFSKDFTYLLSDSVRGCYLWRGWRFRRPSTGIEFSNKNEWYYTTLFFYSLRLKLCIALLPNRMTYLLFVVFLDERLVPVMAFDEHVSLFKAHRGWTLHLLIDHTITVHHKFFWSNCVSTSVPSTTKFKEKKLLVVMTQWVVFQTST